MLLGIYRLFDSLKHINAYKAHVALSIIFLGESIADTPVRLVGSQMILALLEGNFCLSVVLILKVEGHPGLHQSLRSRMGVK